MGRRRKAPSNGEVGGGVMGPTLKKVLLLVLLLVSSFFSQKRDAYISYHAFFLCVYLVTE